jgi:CubicO group peptidase (beta-lactamase class C family)
MNTTRRRALRPWLLAASLIGLGHLTAAAQEPFPGLDAYVNQALATWHVPGISIAIVRNDSVLYTKGYGVRAFGNPATVDDHTLFEIGSSSKAFTATIVAMLVGDGKMRWDAHVSDYLPGFRLYDPYASAELTVRDALTHRSGLARGELVWLGADISRDEVLRRMRYLKPSWGFRSRFGYQNMMYLAAGEAAAKAAGTTWDDLVTKRIFEPLGMTSSVTSMPKDNGPNLASPHTASHDSVHTLARSSLEDIAPAGSINSNARDMAQWLRFQLGDGMYNGRFARDVQHLRHGLDRRRLPPSARLAARREYARHDGRGGHDARAQVRRRGAQQHGRRAASRYSHGLHLRAAARPS